MSPSVTQEMTLSTVNKKYGQVDQKNKAIIEQTLGEGGTFS